MVHGSTLSHGNNSKEYTSMANSLLRANVEYRPIQLVSSNRTSQEIVGRLSGGDMTRGSCSSLALAYAGNVAGYFMNGNATVQGTIFSILWETMVGKNFLKKNEYIYKTVQW